MTSESRRSSWRATHQTRPAVTPSTSTASRTSTTATVLTAIRTTGSTSRSPAVAALRREGRAAGLEPGHRDPERRAGDVVEPDLVEEVHRVGVAPVLTAHAELAGRAGRRGPPRRRSAPAGRRRRVERLERRHAEDAQLEVAARRTPPRRRRGRSPSPSGSGRWCRRRRTRPPRRSGRRSGRRAAPRSSCRSVRPRRLPGRLLHLGQDAAAASSRMISSSCTAPTSGIMISTCGSPPAFFRSAAASAIARTCMANRPGTTSPSRTPRRPSIGFCSCSRRTASSSLRARRRRSSSPRGLGDGHLAPTGRSGRAGTRAAAGRAAAP